MGQSQLTQRASASFGLILAFSCQHTTLNSEQAHQAVQTVPFQENEAARAEARLRRWASCIAALLRLEVLCESPKGERISQRIQRWDAMLAHCSRLTFQYVD